MSTYFNEIAMKSFSDFMKQKASQRLACAQKIYDYIILRDEKLTFSKIEEPDNDWINVTDIFSTALAHEEFMYAQIQELYKIARETDDIGALEFISRLASRQIESVGQFRKLVFRVKNTNIISENIEHLEAIISEYC